MCKTNAILVTGHKVIVDISPFFTQFFLCPEPET